MSDPMLQEGVWSSAWLSQTHGGNSIIGMFNFFEFEEPDVSHLITEDDEPVDNPFSEKQQRMLADSLHASWTKEMREGRPFVAFANVGLFFVPKNPALVPDVQVSLDVELPEDLWEKKNRSYMTWVYGKPPDIVLEIVSNLVLQLVLGSTLLLLEERCLLLLLLNLPLLLLFL